MTKLKLKESLLLLLILFMGFGLRMIKISSLPGGAHRDELAIGYNAYSLLQTGKDEHGQEYPLNFQSLNDYKLPGQIYSTAATISLFGRNLLAVRLPSVLFGTLLVFITFFFTKLLFQESAVKSETIAFIAASLSALSLWHITGSRNGYEPIAGLTFSLISLYFYLQVLDLKDRRILNFCLALLFYFSSTLFYNSPIISMPIILIFFIYIFHQTLKTEHKKFYLLLPISAILISSLIFLSFKNMSGSRVGTLIINNPSLIKQINQTRIQYLHQGLPDLMVKFLVNKPVIYFKQFVSGYFSAFDFSYLFTQGDHNPWHSLRMIGLGTFNLILIPFLGLGLYQTVKTAINKKKSSLLLLSLLLISPLANALTIDAPISNRLMLFHFSLLLIISRGIYRAFKLMKNKISSVAAYALIGLILISYLWPLGRYFYLYNQNLSRAWNPKFQEVVSTVTATKQDYDLIFVSSKVDTAYLQFAFFEPIEPELIQTQAKWNQQGLWQVTEIEQYRFNQLPDFSQLRNNYSELLLTKNLNLLVVDTFTNLPEDATLLKTIYDYQGQPLWIIYQQTIQKVRLNE